MIVNKVLNITSDDVENQKDLQILLDWKRTLQNKSSFGGCKKRISNS